VTFAFTPEQEAMRRTVRDFAAKEMAPHVDEWEAEAIFPRPLFAKMGELGLAGMLCPEEYGGSNLDRVTVAIVGEEIGRVFRSASFIFVHNMVLSYVVTHGTEEQKQRWAVPMARGEKLGAFALTEPSAGSDAAAITTRAVREGDYYVIDGDKRFISNADSADVISVAAKTDPTTEKPIVASASSAASGPSCSSTGARKNSAIIGTTTISTISMNRAIPTALPRNSAPRAAGARSRPRMVSPSRSRS